MRLDIAGGGGRRDEETNPGCRTTTTQARKADRDAKFAAISAYIGYKRAAAAGEPGAVEAAADAYRAMWAFEQAS